MRYSVDPRQNLLFDPAEDMFSPMAIRYMNSDWPGLFRSQLLQVMPVKELAERFDPIMGAPTKELYSMAGFIFLKEYFDLTIEDAVYHYVVDPCWQFALNVNPVIASMSHATVERYSRYFRDSALAQKVFHRVTSALIDILELDVSRQRLDSTHIYSDMATFGRTKLMGVTIKRFLKQLKRHDKALFHRLKEDLRQRYAVSESKLFGDHQGTRGQLRQLAAEDLLYLVSSFAERSDIQGWTTYKALKRVLEEQCDVDEERVTVKKKTGGNVMQNPSDSEASYDGHKGSGYQAQISETCSEANEVQLITGVEVEPAHCSDQDAVEPMLDQLEAHDRQPELLYGDTHYGSDENVEAAARRGVDLQSPVSGVTPGNAGDLTIDDFVIDEERHVVQRCPAGHEPLSSQYDNKQDQTVTVMNPSFCGTCDFSDQCPVKHVRDRYIVTHSPAQRRLAARRAEQATVVFAENYSIRGGGESVNSALKRKTGIGRLRVRGRPNMELGVFLRCAGWNLSRAIAALRKRGLADFMGLQGHFWEPFGHIGRTHCQDRANRIVAWPFLCAHANFIRHKVA
jgi:Transposase DDE domain